jgi:hypothetical protein
MLVAACGSDTQIVRVTPSVPADLRTGCTGWQGAQPRTEGQLLRAIVAEVSGRQCANTKIEAIDTILKESENAQTP